MQRSKSEPVLTGGETLLEELGVKASVKRDALTDAELTILKNEQRRLAEVCGSFILLLNLIGIAWGGYITC